MITVEEVERAIAAVEAVRAWMSRAGESPDSPVRVATHRRALTWVSEPVSPAAEVLAAVLVGRTPRVSLSDKEIASFRAAGHPAPNWELEPKFSQRWTRVEDRLAVAQWLIEQMPTEALRAAARRRYQNSGYDVEG